MIQRDDKNKMTILKAVNGQLKNLREQRHTENGEVLAIQTVLADMQHAVSVFRKLKEEWTERLPMNALMSEDEWEEAANEIALPSVDFTYQPMEGSDFDVEHYKELCARLQGLQNDFSALLTDIKELLSNPTKEKLEVFYNTLLADYEQKFGEKEKRRLWKKIRDASDNDEKLEILQMLKDECRSAFMESGFLQIKASKLSTRKYKTEEERVQAAYSSLFLSEGQPNARAVRKYIFFHKAEMKDAQVKAWLHYDLMLKIIAQETVYGQPAPEAGKDTSAEMAEALKTLYLPRCYTLLAEGYDTKWVEKFVDDLLRSEHGSSLCADWEVDKKRPQVVATVLGLMVEANAIQRGNAEIARVYRGEDDRTFAKYVGNGRKSDYADWATDYAMQQG